MRALVTIVMEQSMEVCRRDHTHRPVRFGQFMLSTQFVAAMGINRSKTLSCESSQSWREDTTQQSMTIMALPGAFAVHRPSLIPAQSSVYLHELDFAYQFSKVNSIISNLQKGKQYIFPCMLLCCLLAQYVKCLAKDLDWCLSSESLILALLQHLEEIFNLFEPVFSSIKRKQ